MLTHTVHSLKWTSEHPHHYLSKNMLIKGIVIYLGLLLACLKWYLLQQQSTGHNKPNSRPISKLPPTDKCLVFTSLLGFVLMLSCAALRYFACLHQQVLCSRAEEYSDRGVLCDARQEGPLRRNPGNHNRNVVERLPTSAEVEFTLSLTNYDTGAMDRSSNMSFRNTVEGQISSALNPHTLLTVGRSTLNYIQLCSATFHSYCVNVLLCLPSCAGYVRATLYVFKDTLICGLKQHKFSSFALFGYNRWRDTHHFQ